MPATRSARRGRFCPLPSQPGHAWLAQHYRWGLGRAFDRRRGHSHVVVVEDDMVFSPDFLLFFQVRPCGSWPPLQDTAMYDCACAVEVSGARLHPRPRYLYRAGHLFTL